MVFLFFGMCLEEVWKVVEVLVVKGIMLMIVDVCFVKFFDCDMILNLVVDYEVLIIIEEGVVGGFGFYVV